MVEGFFKLYGKMDKVTVSLFGRFIAKCASMEDPNEYLKRVLRAELATTDITIGAEDGKGQEA